MREVTIYALLDPDTDEVRYVGKANDLQSRLRCHKYEAKSDKFNTRKANWLKSLGDKEPKVEVLEIADENTWQEVERRWIAELRKTSKNLTNYADGGQTSPVEGRGHTEKSKQMMRESALKNGATPPSRLGSKLTEEQKMKLSERNKRMGIVPPKMAGWNKGKKMSLEFCKQMSEARKGKPWSPARRKAQENKLIKQGI